MIFIVGFIFIILITVLKQYDISDIKNLLYFKKLTVEEIQALLNNQVKSKEKSNNVNKISENTINSDSDSTNKVIQADSLKPLAPASDSLLQTRTSLTSSPDLALGSDDTHIEETDLDIYAGIEIYTPDDL